jgi:hypothetical protein
MSAKRDKLIAEGLIKLADRCSEALAVVEEGWPLGVGLRLLPLSQSESRMGAC